MIPMHDVDSGAVIMTVPGGDFDEPFDRLWMKERKTENASNRKLRQGILILDDFLSASWVRSCHHPIENCPCGLLGPI